MAKKIKNIQVWESKTERVTETFRKWENDGVKFYINYYNFFYGFLTREDAEGYVPNFYIPETHRKHFIELRKNGEWIIKPMPNSLKEFCINHFEFMERKSEDMQDSIDQIYYSQRKGFDFCDFDGKEFFSTYGNFSPPKEGELIAFTLRNEMEEKTYRVINIIKRITDEDSGEEDEIKYKVIVQPYIEGPRKVLTEKKPYYN